MGRFCRSWCPSTALKTVQPWRSSRTRQWRSSGSLWVHLIWRPRPSLDVGVLKNGSRCFRFVLQALCVVPRHIILFFEWTIPWQTIHRIPRWHAISKSSSRAAIASARKVWKWSFHRETGRARSFQAASASMMGLPKCWSWPGSLWSAIIWKHDGMCSSNVAIYPYNLSDSFSMSSISRRFWVVLGSGSELCHTVEHAKAFLRSSHKNSLNYQGWKLFSAVSAGCGVHTHTLRTRQCITSMLFDSCFLLWCKRCLQPNTFLPDILWST